MQVGAVLKHCNSYAITYIIDAAKKSLYGKMNLHQDTRVASTCS